MTKLEKLLRENKEFLELYRNKQSSAYHHLKLKDLRLFVELSKDMDEDSPVLVERVEDSYFEPKKGNGWSVYKGLDNEADSHYHTLREDLSQENWKEEYPDLSEEDRNALISIEDHTLYTEQYYSPWCITADKKESIIKIHSHY